MTRLLASLRGRYAEALENYLAAPGEEALNQAYEIGRAVLGDGLGVLDIAVLHHDVLRSLMVGRPSAVAQARIAKAAEFFAESLSPFEMTLRGYRESNAHLVAMNRALQQAKISAEAANLELEAFSYSVAHDLRAPLRGIDGFSQALLQDYGDKFDGEAKAYLDYLRQSAQSMAQLIDGLLELSQIARSELQRESVDLGELALDVIDELRRGEPGRTVEFTVAPGLVAEGDPRLLRVALQNLLGNAWKFTGKTDRARIEFGADKSGGHQSYFIRDNGAGFDMAYAGKLFGVFQRLHSAREFDGTGIGLATVQRIIRRHGGRIWAEGWVGVGAVFHFTIGDIAS